MLFLERVCYAISTSKSTTLNTRNEHTMGRIIQELPLTALLAAKAGEILSTITTSGGGNPVDTYYSWTGTVKVADGSTWFEITHAEYGSEWLNGEFAGSDDEGWFHVTREF